MNLIGGESAEVAEVAVSRGMVFLGRGGRGVPGLSPLDQVLNSGMSFIVEYA